MRCRRRTLLSLLAGTGLPRPAPAQQRPAAPRRVAAILATRATDAEGQDRIAALRVGLRAAGLAEGRDLRLEPHWTEAQPERAAAIAAEVVAARPDAILVAGGTAIAAVLRETRAIPVVFQFNADPVAAGFVRSLAQPGGNATGFMSYEPRMAAKWLDLLRQLDPDLRRVLVLAAANPSAAQLPPGEAGVRTSLLRLGAETDLGAALAGLARDGTGAMVLPSGIALARRAEIIARLNAARLPAAYPVRAYVAEGGLMSYAVDLAEQYRGAGAYLARILAGEAPSGLPVQAPTRFALALNLRTAREIGIEVPTGLLAAAEELVE